MRCFTVMGDDSNPHFSGFPEIPSNFDFAEHLDLGRVMKELFSSSSPSAFDLSPEASKGESHNTLSSSSQVPMARSGTQGKRSRGSSSRTTSQSLATLPTLVPRPEFEALATLYPLPSNLSYQYPGPEERFETMVEREMGVYT